MNVSVIVPPASIASTRGSRPFAAPPPAAPSCDIAPLLYASVAGRNSPKRFRESAFQPIRVGGRSTYYLTVSMRFRLAALLALAAAGAMGFAADAGASDRAMVLLDQPPAGATASSIAAAHAAATAVLARHSLRRA